MKRNVGNIDRVIRLVLGIGIAIGGIIFESYWGIIGVAVLATAVFSFCPIYALFGVNTTVPTGKLRPHLDKFNPSRSGGRDDEIVYFF